nr:immunoglobulin light chain junction region [Macaca mulatta]MOW33996.1 immunoglobulin light chain junction region [Macaca mulatta]MOW34396.1 immunoglobulin light chain junction region [Macaca mulatta]MOW34578.1 immunoglobulin light chain junction region [Macaca mulatta]MOW34679.1 immunoglobulin light chain junction region [Macaca mulatta]
CQQYNSLPHTF